MANEARYIQEGIDSITQSEVVSFSEDLDSMWESTLSAHSLLKCGTCSPPAIHFSIKERDIDESTGKSHHVRSHDIRTVSSLHLLSALLN